MSGLRARFGKLAAFGMSLMLCLGMLSLAPASASAAAITTVDKSTVAAGQSVTITASGFGDEEEVISWATAPNGAVYETGKAYADESGKVALTVTTSRFWEAGTWAITLHGKVSDVEAIASVAVSAAAADAALAVAPGTAAAGDELSFSGSGFSDDDAISVWVTNPDGSASAVSTDLHSNNGDLWFSYTIADDAAAGTYHITAYGQTSGHLLIGTFVVE